MAERTVNLRSVILDALIAIVEKNEYSHLVMGEVLRKYQFLPSRDRAFISRVTLGTVERMITLDYMLNQISKTPVKKMKPVIRNILRMSAYQLHFMDSSEAYAVCNEAVKLANKRGFGSLKGFVNGVLRNFEREHRSMIIPDLAVETSTPEWIVSEWVNDYGEATAKDMLLAQYESHPLWIRVNTTKVSTEEFVQAMTSHGVKLVQDTNIPEAFMMTEYDYLEGYLEWRDGWFFVQDYSSMQVVFQSGIQPGMTVVDVCAAPGGKATHAAQQMNGEGKVLAFDLSEKKVDLIQENIERLGLSNIQARVWDATQLCQALSGCADVVIADLPCSGLGILNKKPDIKYRVTKEQCIELAALQRDILRNCVQYLKVGGILMYSTCTISKEENENNTEWIAKELGLKLLHKEQMLPGCTSNRDGFYIAQFRKE